MLNKEFYINIINNINVNIVIIFIYNILININSVKNSTMNIRLNDGVY